MHKTEIVVGLECAKPGLKLGHLLDEGTRILHQFQTEANRYNNQVDYQNQQLQAPMRQMALQV